MGNAVARFSKALNRAHLCRFLERAIGVKSFANDEDELRQRIVRFLELDLITFLNACVREELNKIAMEEKLPDAGGIGELRETLWEFGAAFERGRHSPSNTLQPTPLLIREKLIFLGEVRGLASPADVFPRPIPPEYLASAQEILDEPESLEDLLENAHRLVGIRFGVASRDKGAFGSRIALALGVPEFGFAEPDWQGEVEIKTVPVVRDSRGYWWVKEDPAISMEYVDPYCKLGKVLWIARVADDDESCILSWYYQESDSYVRGLFNHYLHTRPKGGAGATTRGWYLHKRFFADSGFLRTLNGS